VKMAKAKDDKEKELKETELAEVAPVDDKPETKEPLKTSAKAGKRSTKAVAETEEKQAKEDRKKTTADKAAKPKAAQKPPRSRSERAGKKYREAIKQVDKTKTYSLAEAIDLAAKTATTNFGSTVELHVNLAVDPKQADQNIRGIVALPNGTGKSTRVAVFAEEDDSAKAKTAGADIADIDELLASFDKQEINFDVLISTPSQMAQLGKYAKLLGPKGLMPNPKSGTVTADVSKAVKEAKAGRVEYRVDQAGIIHLGIGKASFGPQKLLENAQVIAASIRSAKPASVKGAYVKSAYVTSTMGPSIKTEL
jgi:large subunit ribosomal protein L1